jgi:hypothetical protein
MKVPQNRLIEMKLFSTLAYLLSAFASVVARATCRACRDIKSLRGRMGESSREVGWLSPDGDAPRFESLLAESFA